MAGHAVELRAGGVVGAELQEEEEVGSNILEPIEVVGLDRFGESEIVIKPVLKQSQEPSFLLVGHSGKG